MILSPKISHTHQLFTSLNHLLVPQIATDHACILEAPLTLELRNALTQMPYNEAPTPDQMDPLLNSLNTSGRHLEHFSLRWSDSRN